MRELGLAAGNEALVREYLRFVTYDEIRLPYSRSYVALGLNGRAVASFGQTYVWVGGRRVDLPGYVAGQRSGHRSPSTYGDMCAKHHLARSLSGVCELCE